MGACNCQGQAKTTSEAAGDFPGDTKNSAFLFIKPHAVKPAVEELVKKKLSENRIAVVRTGQIKAETIDEKGLIDTHYGAIASRALKQQPSELVVQPEAKAAFQEVFKLSWAEALQQGLLHNSASAALKLNLKPVELSEEFAKLKRGTNMVKLGGGFYVGKIQDIYVVNGFYSKLRQLFTKPGTCIQYYEVEWDPAELSWEKFRAAVVGGTEPGKAAEGSIRRSIFQAWADLGLEAEPDTSENGVHASASPFEGFAEKANWLEVPLANDPFGNALLRSGISESTIEAWRGDIPVKFEGKEQSLFDLLEDLDVVNCLEKAKQIANLNA